MHPAVEGPGLAAHKPLRALAQALHDAGEAAWYAAFLLGDRTPVVVHVAIGDEALLLDAFVKARRDAIDDPSDQALVYRGDALHDGGRP